MKLMAVLALLLWNVSMLLAGQAFEGGPPSDGDKPMLLRPYQAFSKAIAGFDSKTVIVLGQILVPRSAFASRGWCIVTVLSRGAGRRDVPIAQKEIRSLNSSGSSSEEGIRIRAPGPADRTDGFKFTDVSPSGDAALIGLAVCLPETASRSLLSTGGTILFSWRFYSRHGDNGSIRREILYEVHPKTIADALSSPK